MSEESQKIPYPEEEVAPVVERLRDMDLRRKVAARWVSKAVENGYHKDVEMTPAESADDIAQFAILEYQHFTRLSGGVEWATNTVHPELIASIIAEIDEDTR